MAELTGEYEHIIDEKNRLFVSSKLRSIIDVEEYGSDFYLTFGSNKILCLYPEKSFKKLVAAAAARAAAPDEAIAIERMFYAKSPRVEFDRQGRLLLSEKVRKQANLGSELTIIGSRDHVEIWNTDDWQRYSADQDAVYEKLMAEARQAVFQKESQQVAGRNHIQEE